MRTFCVEKQSLLLDYLVEHLAGFKKTKIRQMLKYGSVRVNGRAVTSGRHPLSPGDTIDFLSEKDATLEHMKSRLKFKLIHEDREILVVEKPAGLLTMGTEHEKENTLYFLVTAYEQDKSADGRGRVFIVHRLDRDVSGFVIFAKNPAAKEKLQTNWTKAVKKYYAVTEGTPEKEEGVIKSNLIEDRDKRVHSTSASSPGSKHAVTHYRLLRASGPYALLEITLETGRKNQIRVHLSEFGHPIAGDVKYGGKPIPSLRIALHAGFLSFPHPSSGEILTFGPKWPQSFERLLNA